MRQNKLIKIIKESIKQHNMSLEDKITWGFETLLSSVLYRSKISPTYHHAKQQISHKHILVNNKLVNIWSYRLKVGDEITLLPKARDNKIILDSLKNNRKIPEYLDCANPFVIKMINNPTAASVTHGFNINYPLLIRNI